MDLWWKNSLARGLGMMIRAKAARMDMQEMSERVRKSMLLPLQWFSAATRRNRVPREQQRHLVSRRTTRPYLHPGPSAEGAEGSRPRFNEKSLFPERCVFRERSPGFVSGASAAAMTVKSALWCPTPSPRPSRAAAAFGFLADY